MGFDKLPLCMRRPPKKRKSTPRGRAFSIRFVVWSSWFSRLAGFFVGEHGLEFGVNLGAT